LYNKDCISDQAIIYWHQKGAKPQGKQHFLKSTEPLVKVCRALDEMHATDPVRSPSSCRSRKTTVTRRRSR
jgi:hypothetical protein